MLDADDVPCAAAPDLAASVAHHEARATGLESLLLTFAADALGAIGRNPLPAGTHPVEAARYAAAKVRLFADDVTEARDNHFARAERAEARLAVAQAIILGGHHADDCPARAHEECAHGGYDPDGVLDDCDAGRTPAECAAARGACDCGVLRAVRAVECATPEALRDGAARAAEAAEATASRDRAWRYVHEARTERDALRAVIEGRTTTPHPARRRGRGGLGGAVTRDDLRALMRDIAEAAARCVGAKPAQTAGNVAVHGPNFGDRIHGIMRQTVHLAARATAHWTAKGYANGPADLSVELTPALAAAAVLALRERLTAQAEERRRLLAADEAALRVLDETARLYDEATVADAVREGGGDDDLVRWVSHTITQRVGGPGPWTRADVREAVADACDAILRRRAGGEP